MTKLISHVKSRQLKDFGGIAQLVERLVRNEKVRGSNPLTSTIPASEFKNEIQEIEEKLKSKRMSKEAQGKVKKELKKLKLMSPMSAEATVDGAALVAAGLLRRARHGIRLLAKGELKTALQAPELADEVTDILRRERKTAILVTHDIGEAVSMAERVIVLSRRPGRVKSNHAIRFASAGDTRPAPLAARNAPEFNAYFNTLWQELEVHVEG